jgi:hypothetical protein
MPLLNHSRGKTFPVLPIKGSLFYSVGFKTLFTLFPQENAPVDSRSIYELINSSFKKHIFNHWSVLVGLRLSFIECAPSGASTRGRDRSQ